MKQSQSFVIVAIVGVAHLLLLFYFIPWIRPAVTMLTTSGHDSSFAPQAPQAVALPPRAPGASAARSRLQPAVDKAPPVSAAAPVPGRVVARPVDPGAGPIAGGSSTLTSEHRFDGRAAAASVGHEGSDQ